MTDVAMGVIGVWVVLSVAAMCMVPVLAVACFRQRGRPRRPRCVYCRRRRGHDLACRSVRRAAVILARRDFEAWETELIGRSGTGDS